MNSNVKNHSIVRMEDEVLKQLTIEVKETVVAEAKTFSAVDLWNIQKQMKTASRTTKRWHLN